MSHRRRDASTVFARSGPLTEVPGALYRAASASAEDGEDRCESLDRVPIDRVEDELDLVDAGLLVRPELGRHRVRISLERLDPLRRRRVARRPAAAAGQPAVDSN